MVIREVAYTGRFERAVRSVRDAEMKERVKRQVEKLLSNPEAGRPLRYGRRGELRVGPYPLLYAVEGQTLCLLDLFHREGGY